MAREAELQGSGGQQWTLGLRLLPQHQPSKGRTLTHPSLPQVSSDLGLMQPSWPGQQLRQLE